MELIKKNKAGIAIVLVILILVLIRSTGFNHFRNDAKKWAEPSIKQSDRITIEQAGTLKGKTLIVSFDKDFSRITELKCDSRYLPPDSILSKNYVNMIRKHNGPVLLFSSDPGLSARIWMILSQMGYRNIYILSDSPENEVFKYKFRPDTISN
ncbi:MAG: hypothetical protein WA816_15355 [Bacteroidales bacterium]